MRRPQLAAVLLVAVCLTSCGSESEPAPTTDTSAAAAPTSSGLPAPAEAELNGVYRKFQELTKSTTNGVPMPAPADETYWWAFRSTCLPTGCVATATALDDVDHTIAAVPELTDVFRFVYGAWESVTEVEAPCADNPAAVEKIQKVVRYVPQEDGTLKGDNTQTIADDGCGRSGNVFAFPTMMTRESDAPAGVTIADPATVG